MADTQCFAYDQLRRLNEAWTPSSGDCATAKSTSALGGAAPYWTSWTFDNVNNRSTETTHAAAGNTIRTSAYPAAGAARPHALTSVTSAGPTGTSVDSFTYNEVGSAKTRTIGGGTQNIEYDAEGQVSKVTNANGQVSTYLYDADGNRIIAREPSATTVYAFGQEIRLDAGTSTPSWTRYYVHNGHAIAVRNSVTGLSWLVADHQGSNVSWINATTLAVTKRRMLPYGGDRGVAPSSWPDRHGFVGANKDESGLLRIGARLYDTTSGRFLAADPLMDIGDPQQMNAYADNSPVTSSDPTGLFPECGCPSDRYGYYNIAWYADASSPLSDSDAAKSLTDKVSHDRWTRARSSPARAWYSALFRGARSAKSPKRVGTPSKQSAPSTASAVARKPCSTASRQLPTRPRRSPPWSEP
ncbi:RHS repeat domain-containing protein [Actinokineospora inagensis]|uniref:RHS repeat domain-containing protein n=1 Tax=Actinokineospora inagensis TaxID=103730 RepID=UPI0003F4B4E6|nr:RHS repeat-associated core domain-containing protein [Actinokineospora inagensis]